MDRSRAARGGFTLVEVLVALIILTVGVLGLAGTTALAVRQVALADATSERAAALQTVIERLRATPFANLSAGSTTVGKFSASWTVTPSSTNRTAVLEIVTVGPGLGSGSGMPALRAEVADTFLYRIVRP